MVGYTLRQERERRNLSINDIEQGTSIRALYIEAIEAGEYDTLPGKIYTKGFVKNYAKFLGMDADAMGKEFENDLAEIAAEQAAANAPVDATQNAKAAPVEQTQPDKPERKFPNYSLGGGEGRSSNLLIVAAGVLIAAVAGGLWSWLSTDDNVANVNPPQQVATEPTPPAEPVTEAAPAQTVADATPTPPPPPPSDSLEIQARFAAPCWTLVTIDGVVVQEGVIDGGQTVSWSGKQKIDFRFGNAGAVELFQDGKSLGIQGADGAIADKTFTRG